MEKLRQFLKKLKVLWQKLHAPEAPCLSIPPNFVEKKACFKPYSLPMHPREDHLKLGQLAFTQSIQNLQKFCI